MKRDTKLIRAVKKRLLREERLSCGYCGWGPPPSMRDKSTLIPLHHVVPLEHGGADEEHNLVPLCPNHHAMAHRLVRLERRADGPPRFHGPFTRAELWEMFRTAELRWRKQWNGSVFPRGQKLWLKVKGPAGWVQQATPFYVGQEVEAKNLLRLVREMLLTPQPT